MAKKLEGTTYTYPTNHKNAGEPVINRQTGKPYVWARGTKQKETKDGKKYVTIEVPLSTVRKPNNFFTQGVKTCQKKDKDGKWRDHKYIIGYYRLNRKTQSGHDARVWIVARQYYQGGKPALLDVYYKGMSYYTAHDVFDGIAFDGAWENRYNKKTGKNFVSKYYSNGTSQAAIDYKNRKREDRKFFLQNGYSRQDAERYGLPTPNGRSF